MRQVFVRCSLHYLFLAGLFSCSLAGNAQQSLVSIGTPETGSSLPDDSIQSHNLKIRQWLVGAGTTVVYGSSYFILNNAWYKGYAHTSFHVFNDAKEWLQTDKLGHTWSVYNTARASAALWRWAGLSQKKAAWIGSMSGFIYLTGIEFMDAHSSKWGWSWSDIGSNIVGSSLFLGQELLWKEQRIQYKFSFHRKNYTEPVLDRRADDLFGQTWYERMLKDYNAQSYWLSFNLGSFFRDSNLPSWLNLAAGYGVDGMFGGFENIWMDNLGNEINRSDITRERQYYLSPDIDFTKIKTKSKFLKTAFFMLNAFKMPAPALMLDSRGKMKVYVLYF
jgi:uncharacterized protein YfiM (DUF2279 family)